MSNRFASANSFLEMLNSNFLTQNVLEPTFGNNILDLVLSDSPARIFSVTIDPPVFSSTHDHLHKVLRWEYQLNSKLDTTPSFSSTKYLVKKCNLTGISNNLDIIDWNAEFNNLNPSEMYTKFCLHYDKAIDEHTPKLNPNKSKNIKSSPKWFNRDLKKLSREKRNLWFKYLASSDQTKPTNHKIYKNKCKELEKRTFEVMVTFEKDLVFRAKKKHKLLYSYINDQKK